MATMFRSWSIISALMVLSVHLCVGETSCVLWSSAGPVVRLGSSFKVYCTFNCNCKGLMYSGNLPTVQTHKELNSSTVYLNVVNITERKITYSCHCNCMSHDLDPCGLDISAGYPPDFPENISCIYKILKNDSGIVFCSWKRGRETHLQSDFMFQVRSVYGNHSEGPALYNIPIKETESPSASFSLPRSVQIISVWVQAQNILGLVESPIFNYTLSDIVMPSTPILGPPDCTSRNCIIKTEEPVRNQRLQIQYKTEHQEQWTTYPDLVMQESSSQAWPVAFLEPYRLYHFRVRSKFSTGLWSQWSSNISSWTQEEAPAQALDVWFAPASNFKSMTVYWKEANMSISRGRIIEYVVKVYSPNLSNLSNVSSDVRSYSVPFCADCKVTVWARNSKGLSPPATMTTLRTNAKPLPDMRAIADNNIITISWKKPETAPIMYVLEWYPEGRVLEELRWLRLGKNNNSIVISDIKPSECYEGAVYSIYSESSVSRTRFERVATQESAPVIGPLVQERVKGNAVNITWEELHRSQRRGCITHYTIYLENSSKEQKFYSVGASDRTYEIKDLSPDNYNLWMTASTAKGESSAGQNIKIFIERDTQLTLLLVCVAAALVVLFLLCLCQSSAIKQRFWEFFQCLMLDVVPDPANSKCVIKCIEDQGKMNLQSPAVDSTLTYNEETILVDVEELSNQDTVTSKPTIHSLLPPLTNPSPKKKRYPILTTYLKSISHDSDESSDHTQTSLGTNTTAGYISPNTMENEDDEFSDGDDFSPTSIFPSNSFFFEPLISTGKLTLDAVKIDCSEFFEST
ncbi:interleukin-12 receptor subunit beta-2 [Melanotaenia boesemani]|uniref:interleukin-12 receptor subunit beta-2 n=1 Tax=Melanotaenia boesemani TaxID=1250792 RepID=UPI001C046D7E|nr:interleukin-12 receptor subunit beta-2 [Melanotaenia boesemani]